MTIFNELLSHGFQTPYYYNNHKWINRQQDCGCIIAVCLDILPNEQEREFLVSTALKRNSLKSIIANADKLQLEFTSYMEELMQTSIVLNKFSKTVINNHGLPIETQCAYDIYFINIKKDKNCTNQFV